MPQGFDDLPRGERTEAANRQAANRNAARFTQVIDRGFAGFHVAAHANDDVLGVFAAVRHHEVVLAARIFVEHVERLAQRRADAVVIPPLGNFALHVRILILHHARHHRVGRVHQIDQFLVRAADELLHELLFRQSHFFDGVRGEKTILHVEKWRMPKFSAARRRDQTQVAGFLGIAAEQHAPAAIGDAHQVVMAGMHVQRMAGQCPRADVHHHRQPFAGNGVKHLFHQHEALT